MSTVSSVQRGIPLVRQALALANTTSLADAIAYAEGQAWRDTVASLKAARDPLSTTGAAGLVADQDRDYAASLAPQTIIGRVNGFVRVPFDTRMISGTSGASASWVGEGKPAPFSEAAFATGFLGRAKLVANVVVTKELVRLSSPAAEAVLAAELGKAAASALDLGFIDPTSVAITGSRPASITSGVSAITSTGTTLAQIDADLEDVINALSDAGSDLALATWCMHPRSAVYLSKLRGTGGGPAYPGVNARGGSLFGLPVLTSRNVPVSASNKTIVVLLDPSMISLADDGGAAVGTSEHSNLLIDSAPTSTAPATLSLWQADLVALKLVREVSWALRHAGAAQVLTGVQW